MGSKDLSLNNQIRGEALRLQENGSLSIDTLCEALQISRSQLHRRIKKTAGISTSRFIRTIKLSQARALMTDYDLNIAQIAHRVGYRNPQDLSKYFRDTFGVSPSEYRQQLKERDGDRPSSRTDSYQGKQDTLSGVSIAVLPFEDKRSNNSEILWLDHLSDGVMSALAELPDLRVVGRASSREVRALGAIPEEIGRVLSVSHILTGNIYSAANKKIGLNIYLTETRTGFLLWTQAYSFDWTNLLEMQSSIAHAVADQLQVNHHQLAGEVMKSDMQIYELYLKGKREFELRNDLDLALSYFRQALSRDPEFAQAYISLAYTYIYQCIFKGFAPLEAFPEIKAALQAAKKLQISRAEIFVVEAWLQFYFQHRPDLAITSINKAIALKPSMMDGYRIKAYFYSFQRQDKEALEFAHMAYELDPLGFNAWFSLADIYRRARRYDEALKYFLPLREKFPQNLIVEEIMGLCFQYTGKIERARSLYQAWDQHPPRISLYNIGRYLFHFEHGEKHLLPDLLQHVEKLDSAIYVQPTTLSLIHFYLGNESDAVQALEDARLASDFGLMYLKSDQYWDKFRAHPAVQQLLVEVGMG